MLQKHSSEIYIIRDGIFQRWLPQYFSSQMLISQRHVDAPPLSGGTCILFPELRKSPLWWTQPTGTGQWCYRTSGAKVVNMPHTFTFLPWESPPWNSATMLWRSQGHTEGPLQMFQPPVRSTGLMSPEHTSSQRPSYPNLQVFPDKDPDAVELGQAIPCALLGFLTHRILEQNILLIYVTNVWDGLFFTNYSFRFCPDFCPGREN